jgi:hypothetical protein
MFEEYHRGLKPMRIAHRGGVIENGAVQSREIIVSPRKLKTKN